MSNQDIDSSTGRVITPGQPVQHRDSEDGQSVGHSAEPEPEHSEDGAAPAKAQPTADDMPDRRPPPKVSLEDIYAKSSSSRNTVLASELAEMTDEQRQNYDRMVAEAGGGPDPYAEPEEPAPAQQQPAAAPAQAPQNQQTGIDPNPELTTITVYGMQEQVPTADVQAAGGLSAYQKARAADIRLERVATYEASLRNWENQLTERAAGLEQRQPPAQESGTGISEPSDTDVLGGTADVDALASGLTDAIYSGDREEAAATLAKTLRSIQTDAIRAAKATMPAQAPPSGQAAEKAAAQERARVEANAVFANEFSDLDTPVLRSAALAMVQEVAKDPIMIGRPLAEITREACTRIRQDVYGNTDAPPGQQPTPRSQPQAQTPLHQQPRPPANQDLGQRHAMKRRTVVTPLNEAHGRAPAPNVDAAFPTNREFVANLRKGRGLPG